MTENQPKRERPVAENNGTAPDSVSRLAACGHRNSAAAIAAGLDYLLEHHAFWKSSGTADPWVSACVLIRLAELPPQYVDSLLREKIENSLDVLMRSHTMALGKDDAELLTRAIIALRRSGRKIPVGWLQAVGRCRQTDGGFALVPEDWSGSAPEITVTAIDALRTIDRAAEDFLTARMQSDENHLASWLSVCAGILDWDKGLAPLPLLNQACRLIVRVRTQSAFEQALLLRCLVSLRLQQAWVQAVELRRHQLENGSWPGPAPRRPVARGTSLNPDEKNLIPTVTAVSALAACESQPGLYFGSDLPRPRRLYES